MVIMAAKDNNLNPIVEQRQGKLLIVAVVKVTIEVMNDREQECRSPAASSYRGRDLLANRGSPAE